MYKNALKKIIINNLSLYNTFFCFKISSTGKISDGCVRDLRFNPPYSKTNWYISLMIKSYHQ